MPTLKMDAVFHCDFTSAVTELALFWQHIDGRDPPLLRYGDGTIEFQVASPPPCAVAVIVQSQMRLCA
jgi:hypothetical protein